MKETKLHSTTQSVYNYEDDNRYNSSGSDNDSGGGDSIAQELNETEQQEIFTDMLQQINPIKYAKLKRSNSVKPPILESSN